MGRRELEKKLKGLGWVCIHKGKRNRGWTRLGAVDIVVPNDDLINDTLAASILADAER